MLERIRHNDVENMLSDELGEREQEVRDMREEMRVREREIRREQE
jgi:hypothetical protein